jgi:hypothetical protein
VVLVLRQIPTTRSRLIKCSGICTRCVDQPSNGELKSEFRSKIPLHLPFPVGTFTSGALVPSWASINFPNNTARATALGMIYTFPNLGGIISSDTFRSQDPPVFKLALVLTGCFQAAFIVLGLAMRQIWVWRNKQLDEGKVEHVEGTEQNTEYRYAI